MRRLRAAVSVYSLVDQSTQRKTTLKHRLDIMHKFLDAFEAETEGLGKELTEQMGRCVQPAIPSRFAL